MQAKKGTMQSSKGGRKGTHKSLFIHTLQLPRRPVEETNIGKEVECSALPPTPHHSQQGEVEAIILGGAAWEHFF